MLSVVVLTKNEQDRIEACLESVKWAGEIIVVDSGSTDKTLDLVKKYTSQIIKSDTEDFDAKRNKAMNEAKGDWVLYIDADERVLEPLKEEIQSLLQSDEQSSPSDKSAYAISRRNIIFGKEVNYGPYKKDWMIKLLRKADFENWIGEVHEYPKFKGKLGYFKNSLLHLTHRDIDQIILKSLDWSKIDAKLRLDANHPKMSGWRFIRIFLSEMFKQGIIRQGFFNGTIGIMDSILQAFSMYITYVRLWQMQQGKSMDEIYNEIDKQLVKNNFNY